MALMEPPAFSLLCAARAAAHQCQPWGDAEPPARTRGPLAPAGQAAAGVGHRPLQCEVRWAGMPCTVQAVHGLACAPVCAGLGWHALLAQCMVWRVHPCALGWDGMHCLHSAWLGVCTSARWCGWANREKQHGACLVCAVPHLPA